MAVVIDQHHGFKPPVRSQRCRLPSFNHLDFFMLERNQMDMAHSMGLTTASFHRSSSTPCLTKATKVEDDFKATPRVELIGGQGVPKVRALVVEAAIALACGGDPVPVQSGLGGAYLLCNKNGDTVAVAKPIDEEPLALNNPKGFAGRMLGQPGLKRSVRVGETGLRELAAYLLDHGGFAGVPPTALAKFSHVAFHVNNPVRMTAPPYKIASLQRYVDHDSDAGDLGPSGFSVSSVHRIGTLDVRILNIDRHSGNILVGKHEQSKYSLGAINLIPIDHGLCLPEWLDDPYFEWLHWPQASVPFSESEIEYISNLNPFEDAKLLRSKLPCLSESSIRVMIVCTLFLKKAASAGLCLSEIGEMMTRDCHGGQESMSILENVCFRAKATVSMLHCDIGRSEDFEVAVDEDDPMFHFDEDSEDKNNSLVAGKPPLPPKPQSARTNKGLRDMKSWSQQDLDDNDLMEKWTVAIDKDVNENKRKRGNMLIKSISFAAPKKHEIEGISFGGLNDEEWEFFLEMFDSLLPEMLEEKKSTGILQRVGSA